MAQQAPVTGIVHAGNGPIFKPPPQSAYRSVMIKIRVGTPAEEFSIHKDLLCHHSSYFRGALTGGFKEGKAKQITLDQDYPATFEIFASWAYSGQLYDAKDPDSIKPDSLVLAEKTAVSLSQLDLTKLWIFGDKRGVPYLQNQAVNDIHKHHVESWSVDAVAACLAFEQALVGSKLCTFWIELYARTYGDPILTEDNLYPPRLLLEMCARLYQLRDAPKVIDIKRYMAGYDMCRFHIHDEVDCKDRKVEKRATEAGIKKEA